MIRFGIVKADGDLILRANADHEREHPVEVERSAALHLAIALGDLLRSEATEADVREAEDDLVRLIARRRAS